MRFPEQVDLAAFSRRVNAGEVSDKAVHGYLPAYQRIAAEIGPRGRVLELGIWRGASLRLWQALFPLGEVTGVDNLAADPVPGVRIVQADAASAELPDVVGGPFDLIVDDASHEGAQARASFENLWPLVAPGGFYVVEDWYVAFPRNELHSGNDSMLRMVAGLLELLAVPGGAVQWVHYRYGLAIVRRS